MRIGLGKRFARQGQKRIWIVCETDEYEYNAGNCSAGQHLYGHLRWTLYPVSCDGSAIDYC